MLEFPKPLCNEYKRYTMKKPRLKKILLALLGILVLMQFIRIDRSVPSYDAAGDFINVLQPPAAVAEQLKSSCYDCHSYETKYPWYSQLAPVSWFLRKHIKEGREHLNFSTWADKKHSSQLHALEEAYEEVVEGEMPLKGYLLMHPEAKMNREEKQQLTNWLKQAYVNLGGNPGELENEGEEEHEHEHEHEH